MKALVVDDSEDVREIMKIILKSIGLKVTTTSNAKEALDLLEQKQEFDIALVDLYMPNMNGVEFIKKVRADKKCDHIKMMMVTTENNHPWIEEALKAGANEYLMKPFSKEMIEDKLKLMGLL